MDTDFYLRTRTKGRWPKGKAMTRIKNYHELPARSALLCQAKHHIVLSGDAFLRSVGAQALRGGLAKNYQEL